jgi:hypothetical protein
MPHDEDNAGQTPFFRNTSGKWLVIFAAWTLFAFFFSVQSYLNLVYLGRPANFGKTLVAWLSCVYIWTPITPLVINLAQRFPLERNRIWRGLALKF